MASSKSIDGTRSFSSLATLETSPIGADEVRALVEKFWNLFASKSKSEFEALYSPTATVFAADARRSEPASLMLVRRARELFGPTSAVAARLTTIDVQVLRSDLAVASYAFYFTVTRKLPNGKLVRVEVPFGRATQVFQRTEKGALRIIHEHMSSAEPVAPQELSSE
jgi:ketosteroid isomerase-like protein